VAREPVTAQILFVAANPSIDRLYEVDRLTIGAIHRPRAVAAVPGGKGLNAARAAAQLGGRVAVVGILGGHSGDWIREEIAARGIDASWATAVGQTRTCVSILDRSSGALTEIYEGGDPVGPAAWQELEQLVRVELDKGDVGAVTLSGSLPPGAPADGFGRIAAIAHGAQSVQVLADTYGAALAAVLGERPELVKVNADEAATATGIAVNDEAQAAFAAQRLRDQGAASVVVTLGANGAVIATATGTNHLRAPDIRGPYPVGSGDAFLGGMAVGLVRGDDVTAAARLGMAAGIANAMLPGAGELDPGTIPALLERLER
jgi:1-phosphofructokinase family hexose kinase